MKTVKLVDVRVTEVPYYGEKEIPYFSAHIPNLVPFNRGVIACDTNVTKHYVPVTDLYKEGNPYIAIAYTKEFEEICEIPIRILIKEKDEAVAVRDALSDEIRHLKLQVAICSQKSESMYNRLERYRKASFGDRIRYIFTGKIR